MWRRTSISWAPKALSAPAVTQALQAIPGWTVAGNKPNTIENNYTFKDFKEAMDFMVRVGSVCEKMQHHPCWTNVYNRLHVELTTHDAGNKVTQKDLDLAAEMNHMYAAHTKCTSARG